MAEVIVMQVDMVRHRFDQDGVGHVPDAAGVRAAISHALALAIAAIVALPQRCLHRNPLRQIGQRIEALDTPTALVVLRDLNFNVGNHLQALCRAINYIKSSEVSLEQSTAKHG